MARRLYALLFLLTLLGCSTVDRGEAAGPPVESFEWAPGRLEPHTELIGDGGRDIIVRVQIIITPREVP